MGLQKEKIECADPDIESRLACLEGKVKVILLVMIAQFTMNAGVLALVISKL